MITAVISLNALTSKIIFKDICLFKQNMVYAKRDELLIYTTRINLKIITWNERSPDTKDVYVYPI